jgi:chemotaxis protein methyltransferase CheR
MVRDRSAIELDASKGYLIEARLLPLAKQHGFKSTNEFISGVRAKGHPDLERRVVEAMTTNETSFFRDVHPFNALRTEILPQMRTRHASRRSLNVWSAACSTGQELYSFIMLLSEYFPDLATWNLQLIGTDLSEEVLAKAREGTFSQIEVNRGLPAAMMAKYFDRAGMTWQIRPQYRSLARFSKLNLIERWPPMPQFDIVFLRNVLIYFSPETKKGILRKVRQVMAPQSVLFLGAAETTMGLDSSFERAEIENSVFYRTQ